MMYSKNDHVRPRFGKNQISTPSSPKFEISAPGANSRIYGISWFPLLTSTNCVIYFVSITKRNNYHNWGDISKGILPRKGSICKHCERFSKTLTLEEPKLLYCKYPLWFYRYSSKSTRVISLLLKGLSNGLRILKSFASIFQIRRL